MIATVWRTCRDQRRMRRACTACREPAGWWPRRATGVVASVFCGKGADFRDYVAEWTGRSDLVLGLLGLARARGLAGRNVLVPAGAEALAVRLDAAGARLRAVPSACWAWSARPGGRASSGLPAARDRGTGDRPADWLGGVGADGVVNPGPLTVAVWGFDSA